MRNLADHRTTGLVATRGPVRPVALRRPDPGEPRRRSRGRAPGRERLLPESARADRPGRRRSRLGRRLSGAQRASPPAVPRREPRLRPRRLSVFRRRRTGRMRRSSVAHRAAFGGQLCVSRRRAERALLARYEADCAQGGRPQEAGPANIFEAIFGAASPGEPVVEGPGGVVLNPGDPGYDDGEWRAQGGSEAICVRQCDGGFFPGELLGLQGQSSGLERALPGRVPERRSVALHEIGVARRRDRDLARRRALYEHAERAEVPEAARGRLQLQGRRIRPGRRRCREPNSSWSPSAITTRS